MYKYKYKYKKLLYLYLMITCNLMGGLGNQLFQLFTTISYAIKVKDKFVFLNLKSLELSIDT